MDDRPTSPEAPEPYPQPPEPAPAPGASFLSPPSGSGLDPSAGAIPSGEPKRGRRGLVVGSVITAAVVLVAGAAAAFFSMRGSNEELLTRLPADTQLVVTAYLDPSAGQKTNLFRLTQRFPALGSREQLTDRIDQLLDSMLPQSGLSRDDLDWIGVEVAVAGKIGRDGSPSGGILIATDDEGGARTALEKSWDATGGSEPRMVEYGGAEITVGSLEGPGSQDIAWTVVDGVVVIGFGQEFVHGVIDTVNGEPALADDAAFLETMRPLPTGRLGLLYLDPTGAIEALGPELAPAGQPTGFEGTLGYGMTLSAEPDGFAMDANVAYDPSKLAQGQRDALAAPDHDNPLLDAVPSAAYGLAVSQHFDASIEALIETLRSTAPEAIDGLKKAGVIGEGSILDAFTGDLAIDVTPGDKPAVGGVLMLGTDDETQMQRGLDKLANMALGRLDPFGLTPFPTSPVEVPPSGFTTLSLADSGASAPLQRFNPRWRKQTHGGVDIRVLDAGPFAPPISYAVLDGVAMVASSPDQIILAIDTVRGETDSITSDDGFTDALRRVPDSDALMYVDVTGIVDAVRENLSPLDREMFNGFVAPNLVPIKAIVAGSQSEERRQTSRFFILIP
jgi:uncharacterized protein DUF3352